MSRSFSVSLRENPAVVLERAHQIAKNANATLQGNLSTGIFLGAGIEGSYRIADDTIHITITAKPFITPWFFVEQEVRKFFI